MAAQRKKMYYFQGNNENKTIDFSTETVETASSKRKCWKEKKCWHGILRPVNTLQK